MKLSRTKVLVASVGAAAVIATGAGVAATASGDPATPSTNATGQSLGSAENARSDAAVPDLVKAYATNGKIGYIKKADFLGPELTLDQVGKLPKKVLPAAPGARSAPQTALVAPPRTVPVYDADGKTVIGQFTFGG